MHAGNSCIDCNQILDNDRHHVSCFNILRVWLGNANSRLSENVFGVWLFKPIRHILARVIDVWAIKRKHTSTDLACRWVPKNDINKQINFGYILHIFSQAEPIRARMCTKFGTWGKSHRHNHLCQNFGSRLCEGSKIACRLLAIVVAVNRMLARPGNTWLRWPRS